MKVKPSRRVVYSDRVGVSRYKSVEKRICKKRMKDESVKKDTKGEREGDTCSSFIFYGRRVLKYSIYCITRFTMMGVLYGIKLSHGHTLRNKAN